MFAGFSKLESVSGLFYNVGVDYELTGGGFEDCVNIQDVSYLFAQDSGEGKRQR